jgi:hypothetical protein
MGVHGGAGATTLARALRVAEADPRQAGLVVLVARTTSDGAAAAIAALARLDPQQLAILALTQDAPLRPPAAVTAMRRLLADRLLAVVVLPWQARWRHEHASAATAHSAWTAQVLALEQLIARHASTAQPLREAPEPPRHLAVLNVLSTSEGVPA